MKCLVCNHQTEHYGMLDKTRAGNNQAVPLSGVMVEYVQCKNCKLIFCPELCAWTKEQFKEHIYNDDYIKVDPDYTGKRAEIMANQFLHWGISKDIDVLDYGSGNGHFANVLNQHGYKVDSYEPMSMQPPNKKYDLITCFEVFEHVPDPESSLADIRSFMKEGSRLIFSTLVNNVIPANEKLTHWYLMPRNGHILMHSVRSLNILFGRLGMSITHHDHSMHESIN